jgi:hypothetical protein
MLLTLLLDPLPGIGGLVDALGRLLLLIVLLGLLLYFWLRYRAVERRRANSASSTDGPRGACVLGKKKEKLAAISSDGLGTDGDYHVPGISAVLSVSK